MLVHKSPRDPDIPAHPGAENIFLPSTHHPYMPVLGGAEANEVWIWG